MTREEFLEKWGKDLKPRVDSVNTDNPDGGITLRSWQVDVKGEFASDLDKLIQEQIDRVVNTPYYGSENPELLTNQTLKQ